ncbi:MAG: hypothetical protein KAV44_09720 [Bacteroidales bacterium]|nr:hypothetical protein [Bacteroidales bacterium]
MGITIHYKGKIDDVEMIDNLICEISDICNDMGWDSIIIKKEKNDINHPPIKGIIFTIHKGCDVVGFIFDDNGFLRAPISIQYYDESDKYQLIVSVKTQFSSPDIHVVLIKLLKYIKTKYISNLEVTDEGEYLETSDMERLKYLFDFLDNKINMFRDILDGNKEIFSKSDSPELIADKIEKLLIKYMSNNKSG